MAVAHKIIQIAVASSAEGNDTLYALDEVGQVWTAYVPNGKTKPSDWVHVRTPDEDEDG